MKKILITGSSGYIGSHLCSMLADKYIVHGLDIEDPIVETEKFYKIDITKPFIFDNIEYDAVVHLAALVNVGESERRPISYYITNLNGTMNVINKLKTKNFIFSSTGAAKFCESVYGVSKRGAEDIVKSYSENANMDYTIFRFYNVIGSSVTYPKNPDGLFYNLLRAKETGLFNIYGDDYDTKDGTCVRDYLHVIEVCNSIMLAIEKPSNSIECLGHGVGYTVKEMVDIFKLVNNCNFDVEYVERRKGDIGYYVLDNVSPYMKNMFSIVDLCKIV